MYDDLHFLIAKVKLKVRYMSLLSCRQFFNNRIDKETDFSYLVSG